MGAENIKVEAMIAYYGEDTAQVEKILTRADSVALPLAGKYIKLYTASNAKHIFWFDTGSTPTPTTGVAGATLHAVSITALDSAASVATALSSAIAGVTGVYSASASGNAVTVTHTVEGYASAAQDGPAGVETLFGLQIVTQGDLEEEIGCVNGDIPVTFEESFAEVKCHDKGTTPVAILKTGVKNVEFTLSALETTKEKFKKIMVKSGGSFTPAGGTEVFGMGTYKNFENMFKYAKRLRLHPARLLASDYSEDFTAPKAFPKLKGVTFSGEKPLELPMTFQAFPDDTKNSRVNYFIIGDWSQNLA